MRELIIAILFAKEIMLTPFPVTILKSVDIVPIYPVSAISHGAGLRIDVTSMLSDSEKKDLFYYWLNSKFEKKFPRHSISARLIQDNGKVTFLDYDGQAAITNHKILLIVDNPSNVPTGVKFTRITVRTDIPLDRVAVYWKNYSK